MSAQRRQPVGVVLAGGLGRRLGRPKAGVLLRGEPLISFPLRALSQVLGRIVVVAKADSQLPRLPGVEVWTEPASPRHPLTGLVHALGQADGAPVVVCACDLPLVTPFLVRKLVVLGGFHGRAVIARSEGQLQPLVGFYGPSALEPLERALGESEPLRGAVDRLEPRVLEVGEPTLLFNVNTPEDLAQAEALLLRREGA